MADPIKYQAQEILNRAFNENTDKLKVENSVQTDGSQKTQMVVPSTWVTTAVTLTTLNTAYLLPASEQVSRKVIIIYNVSNTAIYIGNSSVTTATGIMLPASGTMTMDSESGLYAICGTSGKIVNVLEGK
jgi:hypothetical protein